MVAVSRSFPNLHTTVPGFLLARVVGSVSRVKVLGALLDADRPMSGREVARRARMPASTAAQALRELVRVGLVRRETVDGKQRFAVNAQHYLFRPIRALFRAERALPDEVAAFLANHLRAAGAEVTSLALSFTDRAEVLVLVPEHAPPVRGEWRETLRGRYGLELCGIVSNPSAGAARFGVWQEFYDESAGNGRTAGASEEAVGPGVPTGRTGLGPGSSSGESVGGERHRRG